MAPRLVALCALRYRTRVRFLFIMPSRSSSSAANVSPEMSAERENAEHIFQDAKRHHEAGDDVSAKRLVDIALSSFKLPEAVALKEWLENYGPGTRYADEVARVMAAEDHYAVLGLERFSDADNKKIQKEYLKLVRWLHPTRARRRARWRPSSGARRRSASSARPRSPTSHA